MKFMVGHSVQVRDKLGLLNAGKYGTVTETHEQEFYSVQITNTEDINTYPGAALIPVTIRYKLDNRG